MYTNREAKHEKLMFKAQTSKRRNKYYEACVLSAIEADEVEAVLSEWAVKTEYFKYELGE